MGDDITPGELSRRLDRLERSLNEQLRDIKQEIQNQSFIHKDVYEVNQQAIWAALGEINEKDKRRIGWIATGILLPVLLIVALQLLQLS